MSAATAAAAATVAAPNEPRLKELIEQPARCEHLSKKTRIELVGAKNDHNYNQPAPQTPPAPPPPTASHHQLESPERPTSTGDHHQFKAEPEPEPAVEAIAGQMDDCMAAMVLMFLSTRPNEPANGAKLPASRSNDNDNHTKGQRLTSAAPGISAGATAAAAVATRAEALAAKESGPKLEPTNKANKAQPIEMDLANNTSKHLLISNQRRPHFKRRLYLQEEHNEEAAGGHTLRERRRAGRVGYLRARNTTVGKQQEQDLVDSGAENDLELDDSELDDYEDELELAFVERFSEPAKVEDEMIFELQQVDEIPQCSSSPPQSSSGSSSTSGLASPSTMASSSSSSSSSSGQMLARCNTTTRSRCNEQSGGGLAPLENLRRADLNSDSNLGQPEVSATSTTKAKEEKKDKQQPIVVNCLSSRDHADNDAKQIHQLSQQQHQQLQLQLQQQQRQQQQLRFRMNNPVKTRTIFSCMWPSCTKNYDQLADIERHVRLHLGRKQRDSIGDEDFYYEETEVDEPTYLAVFGSGARGRASGSEPAHMMSPSHNSDGLSSGQSFASSSPASSPVCSTDSSSSSANSQSSSVASSSGCGGLGHQASTSSSSQLYANSIDWNHFLADHHNQQQQLALRHGTHAGPKQWLPNNHHQQQQVYRASGQQRQLDHLAGEQPFGRKKRSGASNQSNKRTYLKSINPPSLSEACFLLSPPSSEPETGTTTAAATAAAAATKNHQQSNINGPLQFSMQLTGCSPALVAAASSSRSCNGGGAPFRQRQQRNYNHLAKAGFTSPPSSPSPAVAVAAVTAAAAAASSSSAGGATPHQQTGAKRGRKPNALKKLQQKVTSQSGNQQQQPRADCDHSGVVVVAGAAASNECRQQSNQTSQQFFHHQSTSSNGASSSSNSSNDSSNLKTYNNNINSQQQQPFAISDDGYLINNNSAIASAATTPLRRGRGENRKCRKVYGMERRDLWCTQCKWKKACSRFCDHQ